jgi:hypothetical protein
MSNSNRRTPAQWRSEVAQQEQSGLTVRAYCQREGLNVYSLYAWRTRVRSEQEQTQPVSQAGAKRCLADDFIDLGELGSTGSNQSRVQVKLDFGQGLTLTLVRG